MVKVDAPKILVKCRMHIEIIGLCTQIAIYAIGTGISTIISLLLTYTNKVNATHCDKTFTQKKWVGPVYWESQEVTEKTECI